MGGETGFLVIWSLGFGVGKETRFLAAAARSPHQHRKKKPGFYYFFANSTIFWKRNPVSGKIAMATDAIANVQSDRNCQCLPLGTDAIGEENGCPKEKLDKQVEINYSYWQGGLPRN